MKGTKDDISQNKRHRSDSYVYLFMLSYLSSDFDDSLLIFSFLFLWLKIFFLIVSSQVLGFLFLGGMTCIMFGYEFLSSFIGFIQRFTLIKYSNGIRHNE